MDPSGIETKEEHGTDKLLQSTETTKPKPIPIHDASFGAETERLFRGMRLGPAASFADVLADLSKDSENTQESWARPILPRIIPDKHSITFQKLDIRESVDESGVSEIQLLGVTKAGHSILVNVTDFDHYFYYPAPEGFSEDDLEPLCEYLNNLIETSHPRVTMVEMENIKPNHNAKLTSFLKISVSSHRQMYRVQYTSSFREDNEIEAMCWIRIPAGKYFVVPMDQRESSCQLELSISCEDLMICDTVNDQEKYAPLRILSFDLECHVPKTGFPNGCKDPLYQIANMVSYYGQPTPFIRNVFAVGTCSPIIGSEVLSFTTEAELLQAWKKFFMEVDADIIIGYNITQFDIPFLLKRAMALNLDDFPFLGRIKSTPQRLSDERPTFYNCPGYVGRLVLDVYQHMREHHAYLSADGEGCFKLDAVSLKFLKQKKEDIPYFKIADFQHGNAETRRDLAVYCLKVSNVYIASHELTADSGWVDKDAYLPLLLFDHLKCFEIEIKASREAHIPFNAMRVDQWLKALAEKCRTAIEKECLVVDKF
ncbi:ribonuclease H-like domain-containing protein [Crassisporium funariophilum]|nr:ribonuclease H-like domain-containing protein [Crassisporium funariophilum]